MKKSKLELNGLHETVITSNGKEVRISTRYVPYPLGHGWETLVLLLGKRGEPLKASYEKPLDEKRYGESAYAAENGHKKLVNKWLKGVA